MIEFWWSSDNNRNKIAWVAWQKLCKDKEVGGLGFHDLEKFNQALLGKQAWRILSNPNSLLAQILKHKYFKNCSFMDSRVGTRPSYAWRSILHGREVMEKGLLKSLGNGDNTRVWIDNWLMDKVPRTPCYRADSVVDLTLKVSDLIDQHTVWIVNRVWDVFSPADAPLVLNTKRNISKQDSIIWGFAKDGRYTSKSGYKLLEDLQSWNALSPSLPPIETQLWKDLWKTKTSLKIRHFLWRALSGALAVKDRLRSRGIQVDPSFPVCVGAPETICHVLFNCQFAQEVWSHHHTLIPPAGFSTNSVFLNLHHLFQFSKKSEVPSDVRMATMSYLESQELILL